VREDKTLEEGIPPLFRVAAVVQVGEDVTLFCTLRLAVMYGRRRFWGIPWAKQNPLLMEPGVEVGEMLDVEDFGYLNDGDWEKMVQFRHPVHVSRVESIVSFDGGLTFNQVL
jgi:hypothetical protein